MENEVRTGEQQAGEVRDKLTPRWIVVLAERSIIYGRPGDRPSAEDRKEREGWVQETVSEHLFHPCVRLLLTGGTVGPEKIAAEMAKTAGIDSCEYRLDGFKHFSTGERHPWLASMPDPHSDEAKELPLYRYQTMIEEMADQQERNGVKVELLILRSSEPTTTTLDMVAGLANRARLSLVTVEECPFD